jgi:hypothetical protein
MVIEVTNHHITLTADVANNNMKKEQYIEHITESEKNAADYGDAQFLQAGEKDCANCSGCRACGSTMSESKGNQSAEYYKQ